MTSEKRDFGVAKSTIKVMIIHPNLFLSDQAKLQQKKILDGIKKGDKKQAAFLVTISTDIHGTLDIIDFRVTRLPNYPQDFVVVGIGVDYDDAKQLSLDMISSYYASDLSVGLKEYFLSGIDSATN